MSWWLIILLAIGAYGFKALGVVLLGGRQLSPVLQRCLVLIPAALLGALIAKDTFTTAQKFSVDARLAGLIVAIGATWKKVPLVLVIVLGVGSTALVRAIA
ncbi:MAG: AzlD domain-containing protein [Ilumatobacteraceae bacterium]|nr:AzlD domain-containing protein [Ilumatobacteraceae bacterium]